MKFIIPIIRLLITAQELKSPHLDQAISIICEFFEYLGLKGYLNKNASRLFGSSYYWNHLVEQFSTLGEEHHWIANALFIAVLRDLGLPGEQSCNTPNAVVLLVGKADRLIR